MKLRLIFSGGTMFYNTGELSAREATRFGILFDRMVGTERETTVVYDVHTILCGDLTVDEVDVCRKIEESVAGQVFEIPEDWDFLR